MSWVCVGAGGGRGSGWWRYGHPMGDIVGGELVGLAHSAVRVGFVGVVTAVKCEDGEARGGRRGGTVGGGAVVLVVEGDAEGVRVATDGSG